jgi:hypothetical protein
MRPAKWSSRQFRVSLGSLALDGRRPTRLDLANWIVSRDNPLTARVFANRMWRQFFGTGLSKTLDDLGSQGEWPTHPELLDWLAAEFMEPTLDGSSHPWDVRHLIRTIVLSHTYRQAAGTRPAERDPDNRLLAHQNRIRVDAEIVRDIALSVSGLLVEKFGGPSIKPVQPERYLAALNFPQRDYSADRGRTSTGADSMSTGSGLFCIPRSRPSTPHRERSAPSTVSIQIRHSRRWCCSTIRSLSRQRGSLPPGR